MAGPAGERRIVSVLLADIAESTAIGERLGPERSKFLFDEVTRERSLARRVCRRGHASCSRWRGRWHVSRHATDDRLDCPPITAGECAYAAP